MSNSRLDQVGGTCLTPTELAGSRPHPRHVADANGQRNGQQFRKYNEVQTIEWDEWFNVQQAQCDTSISLLNKQRQGGKCHENQENSS
ncbi:MAG: hypothetical protein GY799_04250 [Desulfobulbaceae bacterium]|nr:hypothetical protein [Desulfobulbaceae bacterium]